MDSGTSGVDAEDPDAPPPPPTKPPGPANVAIAACTSIGLVTALLTAAGSAIRLDTADALVRVVAPYVCLQLATALLAFRMRDADGRARWVAGVACAGALAAWKTQYGIPMLVGVHGSAVAARAGLALRGFMYATTALWECSNAALVVGGAAVQEKYAIATYAHACVAGCAPCQIRFTPTPRGHLHTRRAAHVMGFCAVGVVLRHLFAATPVLTATAARYPAVEAALLAVLLSFMVVVFNVLPLLWSVAVSMSAAWAVDVDAFEVVLPYGALLGASSSREFWSRWSRPAMELIRRMVYYPAGGPQRPFIVVPLMFAVNASSHYDVSRALLGRPADRGWNIVFGLLGAVATLEVVLETYVFPADRPLPVWYGSARSCGTHAALAAAAYIMVHDCLGSSLSAML